MFLSSLGSAPLPRIRNIKPRETTYNTLFFMTLVNFLILCCWSVQPRHIQMSHPENSLKQKLNSNCHWVFSKFLMSPVNTTLSTERQSFSHSMRTLLFTICHYFLLLLLSSHMRAKARHLFSLHFQSQIINCGRFLLLCQFEVVLTIPATGYF